MVDVECIEFLYSRYGQATKDILELPIDTFFKIVEKGRYNFYENRCYQKWLVEGSEKSYTEYKEDFFKPKQKPDLEKALKMAEEIKRKEENM